MSLHTVVGLILALASTTLTNIAYLREHDAAAALPVLSMRRPLHSARLLLQDRSWMLGFAMETGGFLLYAAALALASLALVQTIGAGGIGVLAYLSARLGGRRLGRRELGGVILSVLGLLALAVSLAGGSGAGGKGSTAGILLWLGSSVGAALLVLLVARKLLGSPSRRPSRAGSSSRSATSRRKWPRRAGYVFSSSSRCCSDIRRARPCSRSATRAVERSRSRGSRRC